MWRHLIRTAIMATLWSAASTALPPHPSDFRIIPEDTAMTRHAQGEFDVKLSPQPAAAGIEAARLGRQTIDKTFRGDLEAGSLGEMLAVMTEVRGSAGYVAMERVDGLLHGRRGTFVLQHFAFMDRGQPELSVRVVPDSGTGELAGLSGQMSIRIEGGRHFYGFDYRLPEP